MAKTGETVAVTVVVTMEKNFGPDVVGWANQIKEEIDNAMGRMGFASTGFPMKTVSIDVGRARLTIPYWQFGFAFDRPPSPSEQECLDA